MTYNEFLKLNSTSACGTTVRFKTEYVQLNNLVVVSLSLFDATSNLNEINQSQSSSLTQVRVSEPYQRGSQTSRKALQVRRCSAWPKTFVPQGTYGDQFSSSG